MNCALILKASRMRFFQKKERKEKHDGVLARLTLETVLELD